LSEHEQFATICFSYPIKNRDSVLYIHM